MNCLEKLVVIFIELQGTEGSSRLEIIASGLSGTIVTNFLFE